MSVELASVAALGIVAALLMWTSFRFSESEDMWINLMSQLFHGFSMVSLLGLMFYGYEYSYPAQQDIPAVFMAILGLLMFVYAMFMILRAVFGIIKSSIQAVQSWVHGRRDNDFDNHNYLSGRGGD